MDVILDHQGQLHENGWSGVVGEGNSRASSLDDKEILHHHPPLKKNMVFFENVMSTKVVVL